MTVPALAAKLTPIEEATNDDVKNSISQWRAFEKAVEAFEGEGFVHIYKYEKVKKRIRPEMTVRQALHMYFNDKIREYSFTVKALRGGGAIQGAVAEAVDAAIETDESELDAEGLKQVAEIRKMGVAASEALQGLAKKGKVKLFSGTVAGEETQQAFVAIFDSAHREVAILDVGYTAD
jgi:hypothetical protein